MLYAIQDGVKTIAAPQQKANCAGCNSKMKSFCGDIYIWHCKHEKKTTCDEWFERETNWHLDWKKLFDKENTEVKIHKNDKWHIADIYTDKNVVIELQYSSIDKRDIELREAFYGEKMFWVLNPHQLEIVPLALDKFYYNKPLPFTTYFDTNELGCPIWIADFMNFELTEKLSTILYQNNFLFDLNIEKYIKPSSYKTCCRWGIEDDISRELVREIKLFAREIMKQNPKLKKFSLWRPKKTWSYSRRKIFVDNLDEIMFLIDSYKNDRYGLLKCIEKRSFIEKYTKH